MLLGDIIYKYRTENKMSLQDFANLIGSSRSYVHMLERNFNPATGKPISPSIETLKSIANAMHMNLELLLKQLDSEQYIYLDEEEYEKQFSNNNDFRYASYDGIDLEGLSEEDIKEINGFVDYIRNRNKNKRRII